MFLWAAVEARIFKSLLLDFKPALRLRCEQRSLRAARESPCEIFLTSIAKTFLEHSFGLTIIKA